MSIFKRIAILLSFVLLVGVLLSIGASRVVEAGGDITSEFGLGQGPRDAAGIPFLTPNIDPAVAGSGTGKFEIDGESLEFELEIEAEGLAPYTEYTLSVSLREGHGGLQPAVTFVSAGTATTDGDGRLEFEGEAEFDEALFAGADPGSKWRFDQQIRGEGGGGAGRGTSQPFTLIRYPSTSASVHASPGSGRPRQPLGHVCRSFEGNTTWSSGTSSISAVA